MSISLFNMHIKKGAIYMSAEKFVSDYYNNSIQHPISSKEFINAGARNTPPFTPEQIRGGIGSARRRKKLPKPFKMKIGKNWVNFF